MRPILHVLDGGKATGRPRFVCTVCGRRYHDRDALDRHFDRSAVCGANRFVGRRIDDR